MRFVSNNQNLSQSVLASLLQWTGLLKRGVDIKVNFEKLSCDNNILRTEDLENYDSNNQSVSSTTREASISNMSHIGVSSISDAKDSDVRFTLPSIATHNKLSSRAVRKKSWLEVNHKKKVRREVELKRICISSRNKAGEIGSKNIRSYGLSLIHI